MSENMLKLKNHLVFKIVKILIILLAFCAVIILLVRIVIPAGLDAFWGKDIPLIDDSSLNLSVVPLSQSDNAFYDLNKTKDIIDLKNIPEGKILAEDFLSSDTWDESKVEALLNDNKLALQYFSDAADKQKFQSPATADPKDMSQEIIALNSWRQAAQLSCVRSIWLAKQGRDEEALAESMKVMIIGNAIEKSQTNLVTYLVGISLKSYAIDTLQKIIPNIDPNTKGLAEYKNKLLNYNLSDDGSSWKFEYLVLKNGIFNIAAGKYNLSKTSIPEIPENITTKNSYYFKPNLSIKELFNYYSKLINDAKNPCSLNNQTPNENNLKLNPIFKWYFTENAVNKILISMNDSAFQGILVNKCKIQEKYSKLITEISTSTLPTETYGMSKYIDSTYGFSFWYPSALQVTSTTTNDSTDFPGGVAVENLQIGLMGGTEIFVVNSPMSTITDEPDNHASPIGQTKYFYDNASKQWMIAFPDHPTKLGALSGTLISTTTANISKTTMSGLVMLPSGRRFNTTIIALNTTRFLVISDGGGSSFTNQLAQTISQIGASIDTSKQESALQAESDAYAISNGCKTDTDCQNGALCTTEGPIIADQPIHKICVPLAR